MLKDEPLVARRSVDVTNIEARTSQRRSLPSKTYAICVFFFKSSDGEDISIQQGISLGNVCLFDPIDFQKEKKVSS